MNYKKKKISILIPCHNEGKSIRRCVESCLNQTRKPDEIVVVDDGSIDESPQILKSFGNRIRVLRIEKATGNKSYAQEHGLELINGDIFVATDGDTLLDQNFIQRVEENFQDPQVVAVCGYIKSLKYNWLTALRELEYTIGQRLHKVAQSYLDSLYVIPGCAGAFKTEVFKKYISFDHDTLTEDLDFTYKLHEGKFKIAFDKKAIVYTQDPADIKSYLKQIRRWHSGGWQNLKKHFPQIIHRPKNFIELALLYFEGLVFSTLLLISPFLGLKNFAMIFTPYLLINFITAVYASIVNRRLDLIIYSPLYPVLNIMNAGVFITEFFREMVFRKKSQVWLRVERREIK